MRLFDRTFVLLLEQVRVSFILLSCCSICAGNLLDGIFWFSSSASIAKDATDYIDYTTVGPCMVSSVQILPYRVFWHPENPTYAPERVSFAFYELENANGNQTQRTKKEPFYCSPEYQVVNDMKVLVLPTLIAVAWHESLTCLSVVFCCCFRCKTFNYRARCFWNAASSD